MRQQLSTPQLRLALTEVVLALSDASQMMQRVWKELPSPKNETEQVDYQYVMILNRLWGDVMAVSDERITAELAGAFDRTPANSSHCWKKIERIMSSMESRGRIALFHERCSADIRFRLDDLTRT